MKVGLERGCVTVLMVAAAGVIQLQDCHKFYYHSVAKFTISYSPKQFMIHFW